MTDEKKSSKAPKSPARPFGKPCKTRDGEPVVIQPSKKAKGE